MSARVSFVGAGPGDAELITVRGLARLRAADVVVHDRLVASDLLDEIRVARRVSRLPSAGRCNAPPMRRCAVPTP